MIKAKHKHLAISFSVIALLFSSFVIFHFFDHRVLDIETGRQVAQVGGGVVGPQPHIQRTGVNLVINPSFDIGTSNDGKNGWYFGERAYYPGSEYDETTSRTPGSGSLKFAKGSASSVQIPVTPGKTYIFSAYMKSSSWPSLITMFTGVNASYNLYGSLQLNTIEDKWEEVSMIYKPKEGEKLFDLRFVWFGKPAYGTVWIDDVYFGEGIGFEQSPTPKKSFDGSAVRVDSLGNFQKWNGSSYEPFTPFCICPDNYRTDWSVYTSGGFNCITWSSVVSQIRKAKDVGMVAGLDITTYIMFGGSYYKKFDQLAQRIRDIHDQGLDDSLLMYYFDNETDQYINPDNPMEMWTVAKEVFETIDRTEKEINGGRRIRPIYMLAGNEGVARGYDRYVDVVGSYVGRSIPGFDGGSISLKILNNIEGQSSPLFAQINPPTDGNTKMRKLIYQYVISGAKGFSFWMDLSPNNPNPNQYTQHGARPIEQTSWYTDLPKVYKEVTQLHHVISQPHWVNWTVQSSDNSVIMGGRDYQGESYLILVNDGDVTSPIQFDVSGLNYTPTTVLDAFTGETVASFNGSTFSYSFGDKETAILRFVSNSPLSTPTPPPNSTPTPTPTPPAGPTPTPPPGASPTPTPDPSPSTPTPTPPPPPGGTNGLCGSTLNACSRGILRNTEDSNSQYLWMCLGLNGGQDANCAKDRFFPPPLTNPIGNRPRTYTAPTIDIPDTPIDTTEPNIPSWLDVIVSLLNEIITNVTRGAKRVGGDVIDLVR